MYPRPMRVQRARNVYGLVDPRVALVSPRSFGQLRPMQTPSWLPWVVLGGFIIGFTYFYKVRK